MASGWHPDPREAHSGEPHSALARPHPNRKATVLVRNENASPELGLRSPRRSCSVRCRRALSDYVLVALWGSTCPRHPSFWSLPGAAPRGHSFVDSTPVLLHWSSHAAFHPELPVATPPANVCSAHRPMSPSLDFANASFDCASSLKESHWLSPHQMDSLAKLPASRPAVACRVQHRCCCSVEANDDDRSDHWPLHRWWIPDKSKPRCYGDAPHLLHRWSCCVEGASPSLTPACLLREPSSFLVPLPLAAPLGSAHGAAAHYDP
mmetsp:Transcript_53951/g.118179  ORF Transcript_53951/g.118179 Transcript_53951/m.118179 type:complete len:264 (-) Transcript_53951:455-1246(-)